MPARLEPESLADRARTLVENGWVDLRVTNWHRWCKRVRTIAEQVVGEAGPDSGSGSDLDGWQLTGELRPGALAAWVFRTEDEGVRIKR
jgi:hypothetical protein